MSVSCLVKYIVMCDYNQFPCKDWIFKVQFCTIKEICTVQIILSFRLQLLLQFNILFFNIFLYRIKLMHFRKPENNPTFSKAKKKGRRQGQSPRNNCEESYTSEIDLGEQQWKYTYPNGMTKCRTNTAPGFISTVKTDI